MSDPEDYTAAFRSARAALEREAARILPPETTADLVDRLLSCTPAQQKLLLRNGSAHRRLEVVREVIARGFAMRYVNPLDYLRLAGVALRVARHVEQAKSSRALAADALLEAWAHLGNARRIIGLMGPAAEAFEEARRCVAESTGDPTLQARLAAFEGSLYFNQRELPEACRHYRRAAVWYWKIRDLHSAGEALIAEGRSQAAGGNSGEAIRAYYWGLRRVELARDIVPLLAVVSSLANQYLEAGKIRSAAKLLAKLEPLRTEMPNDTSLLRLLWLDARVAVQIGASDRAIALLTFLHHRFRSLEMLYDTALSALDLAALHAQRGDTEKVCALASEMLPIFTSQKIRREARQALMLWADAAQKNAVSVEHTREVAARIERLRSRRA